MIGIRIGLLVTGTLVVSGWGMTRRSPAAEPPARAVMAQAAPVGAIDVANSGYPQERSVCLSVKLGPHAATDCGDLRIVHPLSGVRVFNTDVTPTLLYNSQFAHPRLTVPVRLTQLATTTTPDSVELKLCRGAYNTPQAVWTCVSDWWQGSDWPAGVTSTRRVTISADAIGDTTGVYSYYVQPANWYGLTRVPMSPYFGGGYHHVNRSASPYGAGWWLAGVEQVKKYYQSGTTTGLLWVGGDGSTRTFTVGQAMYYDRADSILYNAAQQVYVRHLPEGRRTEFDLTGRHVRTVNRFGRTTTMTYTGPGATAGVLSLQLPAPTGLSFGFTYVGGRLAVVTAPPIGSTVRRDTVATTGGNVLRIRNAGDSSVQFAYHTSTPSLHVLQQRTSRRAVPQSFTFDSAYKVQTASVAPGFGGGVITTTLRAGESRGLPRSGTPAAVDTGKVYTWVDGPRPTPVVDTTVFVQGRYGEVRRTVDAVGAVTHVRAEVSFDGWQFGWKPTRVQRPLGQVVLYEWDDRGNVLRVIDSTGTSPGVPDITVYEYDPKFDQLTFALPPMKDSVRYGVDTLYGRRDWQQDARGLSSRVNFTYHTTYAEQVTGVTLVASGTLPAATHRYAYSATLRNIASDTTPLGYATTYTEDEIGRRRSVTTPIDSLVSLTARVRRGFGYSLRGDLIADTTMTHGVTSAESIFVSMTYDPEQQRERLDRRSLPDLAGIGTITTRWRYDLAGRMMAEEAADGRVDSTAYDPAGNATHLYSRRFAAGVPSTMQPVVITYDVLNRPERRRVPAYSYPGVKQGIANLPSASTFHLDSTYGPYAIPLVVDTFTYTADGKLKTANNRWARISRGYNVRGDLTHDTLTILRENGTLGSPVSHQYATKYQYDRNARRKALILPSQFVPPGQDSTIRYLYSTWGALERVIDPRGTDFTYTYDGRSTLVRTTFGTSGVSQSFIYDQDGRLRKDSVSNATVVWPRWPRNVLRRSFFRVDGRGLQLAQDDSAWYAERTQTSYTGLGYVKHSFHEEDGKLVAPGGVSTYFLTDRDTVVLDGLGNRRRAKNIWETSAGGPPVIADYTYQYAPTVGRLLSMATPQSPPVTRTFAYDSAGNETFSSLNGSANCSPSEDRASFYDGLQRLVAEQGRWVVATCNLSNAYKRSLEQYRYDALGRRVWVHAKQECDGVPAGYPEAAGGLAVQCRLGYMRRTVWDGEQELAEVQAPGAPADAAMWEQDVGHYAALPLDFRSSPPKDPNRYYGQVVYTTGLAVDQPLSVQRLGYADRPTGSSYTQWSSFGVIPLWDRQGTAKLGVFSDGAWARQLVPSPTLPCQLGASAQRCVQLVWPEASSIFDAMRGWAPQSYMGSLLEQKRNASGTYYRRARVYDPATGRFTQEDPIGLAGGLNLYGYANGDPVNFSDPFGLCVLGKDCLQAYLAWRQANMDRCMADIAGCMMAGFGPANLKVGGAIGAMRGLRYQGAPYHGRIGNALKSAAPENGQDALMYSLQVKPTSARRVGIDYDAGSFVVFDETGKGSGVFHGHVRGWNELTPEMQRTLVGSGMVDRRGRILGSGTER